MKKKGHIFEKLSSNILNGDRVIWIILIILMMFSLVAIFSSTSLLAIKEKVSRTDIFIGQVKIVLAGLAIVILSTTFTSIRFFRATSRFMFLLSLTLLLLLTLHVNIAGIITTPCINHAYRSINILGINIQVFEIVKIAMVMYLAWAIQTYENDKFTVAEALGTKWPGAFGWMKSAKAQRWIYIFIPFMLVLLLTLFGSTSSAIMTGTAMFATIVIGGIKWRDIFKLIIVTLTGVTLLGSLHIISSAKFVPRMETVFGRCGIEVPYPEDAARQRLHERIATKNMDPSTLEKGSDAYYDYLNEIRQPRAAEIAIVEGGRLIVGKGPGKSSQKYVVPVMFEDYMFSFIVEEYGLLAGFIIIIMYLILFARGQLIVCYCNNRYAKACVGGLVFLITFQALLHVLINCNVLGFTTGQTLPLISHGRFSFLCFSAAFGVILCISKIANETMQKQQEEEQKLLATDEVQSTLAAVEDIDAQLEQLEAGIDPQEEKMDYNEV